MLPSARSARRAVVGAIGTGLVAGAMLFGPPPPRWLSRRHPQFRRRARPPKWRA